MKAATKAYPMLVPVMKSVEYQTYGSGSKDVLGKDDSLGLDDKEVNELMNVPNKGIQSLTRNCVVPTRANLSSKTVVENDLAKHLGKNGYTKDHPRNLESPSEKIQVSRSEDSTDDSHISNGRCAYCVTDVSSRRSDRRYESTYEGCSMKEARRKRSGSV
jgi:hypothetical protein